MCAKKSVTASRCESPMGIVDSSSALGNTIRSRYRVLRAAMGRPIPRSVHRDCASRNALSGVKVSSPDKHLTFVAAMRVYRSEAISGGPVPLGATGVQVHGEFRRRLLELGRSLKGRSRMIRFSGQGLKAKFKIIPIREVRGAHISALCSYEYRNEVE
jgi:hypothetical protein